MKKNTQIRYRYVNSLEEMNKIIKIGTENSFYVMNAEDIKDKKPNFSRCSVLEDKERYIHFTTKFVQDYEDKDGNITYGLPKTNNNKLYVCTWVYDKTGAENYHIHPSRVKKMSDAAYKVYDIIKEEPDALRLYTYGEKKGKPIDSARPILGHQFETYEGQIYGYDLNSAYATVLSDKFIDTYNYRMYDIIKKNEVGFLLLNEGIKMITEVGKRAEFVFPLIESPFKDFVNKWYTKKKTSPKGSKEKAIAKEVLNLTVGIWQNHNPFARAYVVESCNNYIKAILEKHRESAIYWNTDSIYSSKPLDELEIGEEIGQWKLEYKGLFRQKKMNYQKVDINDVCYRGVVKARFSDDFNLLTDDIPKTPLKYRFDYESMQIIENQGA